MTQPYARQKTRISPTDVVSAYLDDRNDALLDALVTAAALVARADGSIEAVERSQFLHFLSAHGLLALMTREDFLDAFDVRLQELEGPHGAYVAARTFERLAGLSVSRLVIDAGEQIALADGNLHPREADVLRILRLATRMPAAQRSPDVVRHG